ncbi:MAG: DUF1801 domain-containing protein [Patescibacteria group bacterium]
MSDAPAIDAFIATCRPDIQDLLRQIRDTIKQAVPDATEVINYGIPTFQLNGKNLVHYGPGKNHIGFYATPDGHAEFEAELNKYKRGKGSVQFPLDQPLPLALIRNIAIYRSKEVRKGP